MAKTKAKPQNQVLCVAGLTYVDCAGMQALYKYRKWVLKINPALLFPAHRKEHRKLIIINGKRYGWAEIRSGMIPLPQFKLPAKNVLEAIRNFIRHRMGYLLKSYEKGYIYVAVKRGRYIVLKRKTPAGFTMCEVFRQHDGARLGHFVFSEDFTEVYPYPASVRLNALFCVIIGYVADTMVYNKAVEVLNKTIKIVV